MSEISTFESRLIDLLSDYAGAAPVEIEPIELAATIAQRERRSVTVLGRAFVKPRWLMPLVIAVLLAAALFAAAVIGAELLRHRAPTFVPLTIQPVGFMTQQRGGAAAALLGDGRVLVAGGGNAYAGANVSFAEIFDPMDRTFQVTGSAAPRDLRGAAATTLRDGRVLITGGYGDNLKSSGSATLYDPRSATFVELPQMSAPRSNHASVVLADGRVVLIGGASDVRNSTPSEPSVEFFDPASLTFEPGPDPPGLQLPSALAFPNGTNRLLVLGTGIGVSPLVFDLSTLMLEGPAASPISNAGGSVIGAAQLDDGRLVIALAGDPSSPRESGALLAFDPIAATMTNLRAMPQAVLEGPVTLSDGRLFAALADATDCTNVSAWVYGPSDDSFTKVGQIGGIGSCSTPPSSTITALADGGALIAGGYMSYGGETSAASVVHP